MNDIILNENENSKVSTLSGSNSQEAKSIAEIQSALVMAKRFPRNEMERHAKIIESCKRMALAEQAFFAYKRGGTLVEGETIRLAEEIARTWTNCKIGIEILSQTHEKTEARAYAIDLESLYIVDQSFTVPHVRTTKKDGTKRLTDERDIREMVNNIGSRILRGCIWRMLPGDVKDDASAQCKKTLASSTVPIKDQIKNMVIAFDEQGVKVEHLEKFLGHNIDSTIVTEIIRLKAVYKSLKDGMAKREEFFDIGLKEEAQEAKDKINEILGRKKPTEQTEEKNEPESRVQ